LSIQSLSPDQERELADLAAELRLELFGPFHEFDDEDLAHVQRSHWYDAEAKVWRTATPEIGNSTDNCDGLPILDLSDDENEDWLRTVRKKLEKEAAKRRSAEETD
jgi:hypothetical protein